MKSKFLLATALLLSAFLLQGCDELIRQDPNIDIYDQSIDGDMYTTVELHIGDTYSLSEGYAPRYFIFRNGISESGRVQIWSKKATKYGDFYYDSRATSTNGYVDTGSTSSDGSTISFSSLTRGFTSPLHNKTFKIIREEGTIRLQSVDDENKYLKLSFNGPHLQGFDMIWNGKEAVPKTAE